MCPGEPAALPAVGAPHLFSVDSFTFQGEDGRHALGQDAFLLAVTMDVAGFWHGLLILMLIYLCLSARFSAWPMR